MTLPKTFTCPATKWTSERVYQLITHKPLMIIQEMYEFVNKKLEILGIFFYGYKKRHNDIHLFRVWILAGKVERALSAVPKLEYICGIHVQGGAKIAGGLGIACRKDEARGAFGGECARRLSAQNRKRGV